MGPNRDLPPLSVFAARSSLAMVLAFVVAVTNMFGVNLFSLMGMEEHQILDALEGLVLLGSVVWFWVERRAPNRRLVIKKRREHDGHDPQLADRHRTDSGSGFGGPAVYAAGSAASSGGSASSDGGDTGC